MLHTFVTMQVLAFVLKFIAPTHPLYHVHINTRSGKEMFHTSSMTSPCSKVQWSITFILDLQYTTYSQCNSTFFQMLLQDCTLHTVANLHTFMCYCITMASYDQVLTLSTLDYIYLPCGASGRWNLLAPSISGIKIRIKLHECCPLVISTSMVLKAVLSAIITTCMKILFYSKLYLWA